MPASEFERIDLNSFPPRSRVRFLGDWTEGAAGTNSVFAGPLAGAEQKKLQPFAYARGKAAIAGGFGKNGTATARHTNITVEKKLPGSSESLIFGIGVLFDGLLGKPLSVADTDSVLDDRDGKQQYTTKDATLGALTLADIAMRQICMAYGVQLDKNGTKFPLPPLNALSPGGLGVQSAAKGAKLTGPVLWFPSGIRVTSDDEVFVELQLERDIKNHQVAPRGGAGVEEPTVTIRDFLGYPAGANPVVAPAGTIMWTTDADVVFFTTNKR